MTSGFHSNELLKSISNYPISKGDLPGHEFHGNQYTAAIHAANQKANSAASSAMASGTTDDHLVAADAHREVASHHTAERDRLRGIYNKAMTAYGNSRSMIERDKLEGAIGPLAQAIDLHEQAANAHYNAADSITRGINQSGDRSGAKDSEEAVRATDKAVDASRAANGVSKSVVAKGDLPGHAFHGNQYTDSVSAEHSAHAKTHEARSRELLRATRAAGWTHTQIMEDPAIKAHLDARIAHETAANIASSAEKGVATAEDAEAASIKAYKASNEAWAFDPDTPRPREYYLADEGMGGTRP